MKLTLSIVRDIVFTTYIINACVPKQVDIGFRQFSRIHNLLLRCFISDHWHEDE